MARSRSNTTTDHEEIRRWAEERGGRPACVRGTGGNDDIGMIRIDFPGYSGEQSLEHIGWDDWFRKFDENNLALVYQDSTAGGQKSNFNKLIGREAADARADGNNRASRRKGTAARATSASRSRSGARSRGARSVSSSSSGTSSSRAPRRSAASRSSSRATRSDGSSRTGRRSASTR